jgi:hypothetical protein
MGCEPTAVRSEDQPQQQRGFISKSSKKPPYNGMEITGSVISKNITTTRIHVLLGVHVRQRTTHARQESAQETAVNLLT